MRNLNKSIKTKILKVEDKRWIDLQNAYYIRGGMGASKIECVILKTSKSDKEEIILYNYDPKYPQLIDECTIIAANSLHNFPESYLILPSSIKQIEIDAFSGSKIKTIEFPNAKISNNLTEGTKISSSIKVIVPQGSYNQFKEKISSPIYEKGKQHTFVYSPEKDGSLNEFLANDRIELMDTLKIVGKVPDNFNFKKLKDAKNLRVVDLSQAEIMKIESNFKDEEYEMVYEVVEKLMNSFIDRGKEIQRNYNYNVGMLNLLGSITEDLQSVYDSQLKLGDYSAVGKSIFNNRLNEQIKEGKQSIKNPDDKISALFDEYKIKLEKVAKLSDQFEKSIDNYNYVSQDKYIIVANTEEEIKKYEKLRGRPFTDEERRNDHFCKMLENLSNYYIYIRVWSAKKPGDFYFERKRRSYQDLIKNTNYNEDKMIQNLANKLQILNKQINLPNDFNEIPNLNQVIINKNQYVNSNNIKYNIIQK